MHTREAESIVVVLETKTHGRPRSDLAPRSLEKPSPKRFKMT